MNRPAVFTRAAMPVALLSLACGTTPPPGVPPAADGAEQLGPQHAQGHQPGQHVHRARRLERRVRGPATILAAPEGDSHIALVDVRAPSADSAVALAWASYKPDAQVAAQGRHTCARQGWLDRTVQLHVPDLAQREAQRRRVPAAGRDVLDGRRLRHERRDGRKTPRRGGAHLRPAPAQGLRPGVVRRKEGAPARRRATREARKVHRGRHEGARRPGRGRRYRPGRQGGLRRRVRRSRARQAGEARREHAVHGGIQHQGAHHADAGQAGRREQAGVGDARHLAPALVQAWRRRPPPGRCW